MIRLGELVTILDLHRQGLSVSAIARQLERDRKTVRKYIERRLDPPIYGPRQPRSTVVAPFAPYLRERIAAFPELTGSRLLREIKELGYTGGYTAVKDFLRTIRPKALQAFERRFETPPGKQAQVNFAYFRTVLPAWTPPWKELVLIPSTNHQSPPLPAPRGALARGTWARCGWSRGPGARSRGNRMKGSCRRSSQHSRVARHPDLASRAGVGAQCGATTADAGSDRNGRAASRR